MPKLISEATPPVTRRHVLASLPALAAAFSPAARAAAQQAGMFARQRRQGSAAAPAMLTAFIGTDTDHPGARGIYASSFNMSTGQLSAPRLVAETHRPSFLAQGFVPQPVQAASSKHFGRKAAPEPPPQPVLYAANEGADAGSSFISTFAVHPADGSLRLLGQVPAGGAGPCFVSVHPEGRWVYAANYMSGTVAGFLVRPDGTLAPPGDIVDFRPLAKHGPNAARQDAPHPHSCVLSPDGRFLVVDDLGTDSIVTFPIDPGDGHLGTPHVTASRMPGAGPRHVAFHPNGHWVYGIDELSNKIVQYLWNTTTGRESMPAQAVLSDAGEAVSTLDPGYHGQNTAAEIAVSPEGTHVYASNRGEDSLVVFAVNPANGTLSPVQRIGCGGKTPRQFTLAASGNWLLCGNQGSDSMTVFARDGATGKLRGPVQTLPVPAPMMVLLA